MKSYLVQRATSYPVGSTPENKTGIDKLVRWEYMGSAEFEFGALSESLQRIRKEISKYDLFPFEKTSNGHPVYLFCKKDQKDEIFVELNRLKTEKYCRLKEYIKFSVWFDSRMNHIPSRKELKIQRKIGNTKILIRKDQEGLIWKETYEEKDGKIIWSEMKYLENFWFDIGNDFIFFVDETSSLKDQFLEAIKGESVLSSLKNKFFETIGK